LRNTHKLLQLRRQLRLLTVLLLLLLLRHHHTQR
jgi:hypothetical protein